MDEKSDRAAMETAEPLTRPAVSLSTPTVISPEQHEALYKLAKRNFGL